MFNLYAYAALCASVAGDDVFHVVMIGIVAAIYMLTLFFYRLTKSRSLPLSLSLLHCYESSACPEYTLYDLRFINVKLFCYVTSLDHSQKSILQMASILLLLICRSSHGVKLGPVASNINALSNQ